MSITVNIKLFAAYQEITNQSEIVRQLPTNTPVKEVLSQLIQQYPTLKQWEDVTRFGVNLKFVEKDQILNDGDELVLIPPVSGG